MIYLLDFCYRYRLFFDNTKNVVIDIDIDISICYRYGFLL